MEGQERSEALPTFGLTDRLDLVAVSSTSTYGSSSIVIRDPIWVASLQGQRFRCVSANL
jgi:hypothetical protein